MNQANRDIDEMLAGMWEALGDREPNEAIKKKMAELEAEKARNTRDDWHGWECYCQSCCE